MIEGRVDKLINPWDWKRILRSSLIKVSEIYINPSLTHLLLEYYGVGQPFGVKKNHL